MSARMRIVPVGTNRLGEASTERWLLVLDQLGADDNEAMVATWADTNVRTALDGCAGLVAFPFTVEVER